MKKSLLVATLVILAGTFGAVSANAYDVRDRPQNRAYRESTEFRQLRAEIYLLNVMFSRVDAQLGYGRGRYLHSDYSRLLRDRDRLNYELQRGSYDRLRIHSQIDRLRDELRELEVRLRFRSHGFYRGR